MGAMILLSAADSPRLNNINKCNGGEPSSLESQLAGCTSLIKSGAELTRILALVYNNRGNAFIRRGQYDRAIEDYNQSIKFDGNYAMAYNNRGVAYYKKGDYGRAIEDFANFDSVDPSYG